MTKYFSSADIRRFLDPKVRVLPVMEEYWRVKYDEVLPAYIAQALETGRLQQTPYSKYREVQNCSRSIQYGRNVMSTKDVIKKSILEGFSMEMSTFHVVSILLITTCLFIFLYLPSEQPQQLLFRDFNKALAIMPVLTAAIVALQASLVISLGMVGALASSVP